MANITLLKHDGLPLTLPLGSIRALISSARNITNESGAPSFLVSDFRGLSVFMMAHQAKDIADQMDGMSPKKGALSLGRTKKSWQIYRTGDDNTYLEPGAVLASEGVIDKSDETKEPCLLLHWTRPDGSVGADRVDFTPENMALAGAVELKEGPTND